MQTSVAKLRPWALPLAATLAGLAGVAVCLWNTEAVVTREFSQALSQLQAVREQASERTASAGPRAESEDFWLGYARIDGAQPVSWTKPFSVGDRITTTTGGEQRTLEVIDVRPLSSGVTRIDTAGPAHRMVAVTCRDSKDPTGRVVRFYVESDDPAGQLANAPSAPKPQNSL